MGIIKDTIEQKTAEKKEHCRQLQWEIDILKGQIEAAKRSSAKDSYNEKEISKDGNR